MENNYNYSQPRGSSPGTPRQPMQYFTSGSSHNQGTPPTRFSSSTPNSQYRTPRMQHPHMRSPYGSNPPHGSPLDSGFTNSYQSGYSPQYTPSPVRPRHYNNNQYRGQNSPRGNRQYGSPNHSFGRGGSSFRGRGMGRDTGRAPIERYYKEDMLRDPWQGLQPYVMEG